MITENTISEIKCFIKSMVEESKTDGVVIGISGGIDSAVVATLAVQALGENKVFGLLLPMDYSSKCLKDSELLAQQLKIKHKIIPIKHVFESFELMFLAQIPKTKELLVLGNLQSRIRMCILYAHANAQNKLVIGTTNLSEYVVGYYTKFGDGANDLEPVQHLTKTQIREIAKRIGVPQSIIDKPPAADLGISETDEAEMGFTYENLDKYINTGSSNDVRVDRKIEKLYIQSAHKRKVPPSIWDGKVEMGVVNENI